MSLRSKRLDSPLDPAAARFLDSTREDAALLRDDLVGTLAHVAVLEKAKILTSEETHRLRQALAELYAGADSKTLDVSHEDVHMNVEAWLTERVGDLGRKVHTGRSRNDQVALDLHLWARRATIQLANAEVALARALLAAAEKHPGAVLPGHTHFQIAQPLLLSHQLGAHVARLERDLARLRDAYARVNVSPLGAGALAGTSHAVDPALAAKLLAFDAAFTNSADAVSDRDFVQELLFAEALLLNHLSGLAEEFILFSHPAFGFVSFDDAFATGSSLMPQKKNPDVLEVTRAKAATVAGALTASLTHTRALPLAYNRDLQEQKRLLLDTFPVGIETTTLLAALVSHLTFHPEAMKRLAGAGYADATELADYLVRKGVPFRDAHGQAGNAVRRAIELGKTLVDLPLAEFKRVNPKIAGDVYDHLGPEATVAAKTSPGGTSPKTAQAALRTLALQIDAHAETFATLSKKIDKATQALLAQPRTVTHK